MADVAQLVRASDCGSEGRGFKSHHSPQNKRPRLLGRLFFYRKVTLYFIVYMVMPVIGTSLIQCNGE